MATYSYSKAQLNKRDQPAKPFWSLRKIAVAAAAFTVTCVAISANQPAPVVVAPAAPVTVAQPAAPVVVAPAAPAAVASPKAESAPVQTPSFQYTSSEALAEMCEAGRQYREDVMVGGATHRQAENEVRSYAHHLSNASPATYSSLVKAGQDGLWLDACY